MILNKIKDKTTWSDASNTLNENFARILKGIREGIPTTETPVDEQMSDESENAVQNRVIKRYVDDEVVYMEGYSEEKVGELEANIKANPSQYVRLKTVNGKSLYGTGNIVIEGGEGGAGLQYATERTVYLTKIESPDISEVWDITEEQRAYNIETLSLAGGSNVCLSFMGNILGMVSASSDGAVFRAGFNVVQEYDGVLASVTIIITADGNAVGNVKEIPTGLKYAVERTVYLTRAEYDEDEPIDVEITEEERTYNIETYTKASTDRNVFVTYLGTLLSHVLTVGHRYASFNCVAEIEGVLNSMTITISANGDAEVVVKTIQTGGGSATPSDMNSDFNNDF